MYNAPGERQEQSRWQNGLTWKHWTGIILVIALCCGGLFVTQYDFSDPQGHIEGNYTRAESLDEDRGQAFTSTLPPATVADRIDSADSARDRRQEGDTHFLQYKSKIVSVAPHEGGSKILLFEYRDGYSHYSGVFLLWGWSASPPSPFRGGGPGSGK